MVTKVNSRCYRFSEVDFEPESRSLYWRDSSVTTLTYEECRLLEMLCYHAGEVLSARVLYTATSLPDSSFSQHQNSICSLLAKAYRQGEKVLPLDVVGDHGYRIALPQKTYQRQQELPPDPSTPDELDINIGDIVADSKSNSKTHLAFIGALAALITIAGSAIYFL
ncbi:hypothetical protein O1O06_15375 [Grimontia hollisae]|uniref:OmpR/PhoB-type domain-containing protein n=3 Tax=Grimontia hollisae TaxID=673 RepID=D0IA39_GRIHO|nr:hypothetical protein [Grimontia hollisae]EEY70757.1 hypothetical protein VHA_002614 [Grimontia hollisae CIP 101886]MDF2186123.1 hypothetical protein [Grimontia hollisae]STO44885.1 Uncharacterised protein [Grimontia hollisae]STO57649.1 Uncharacterised protein [Grimontia hollisae]STQ75428.1 Uncharacterised protein [Grimontia hollisae]